MIETAEEHPDVRVQLNGEDVPGALRWDVENGWVEYAGKALDPWGGKKIRTSPGKVTILPAVEAPR